MKRRTHLCLNRGSGRTALARILLGAGALLCLGLSGCGHFWDNATAHDPRGNGFPDDVRFRWKLLTDRRPPHVILAEEKDNDLRMPRSRNLKEPLKDSGTPDQQAKMIALLGDVARNPKEPMACRLAAVEKLGEFSDPAVVPPLKDAFFASVNNTPKNPVVRMAIIDTLAQRNEPVAADVLVKAIKVDPQPDSAFIDSSQADVRIAAARGLANFPEPEVANALYAVLVEEKRKLVKDRNMALRQEAHHSLKTISGKDYGPEPEQWHAYLSQGYQPVVKKQETFIEQVGHWLWK